MVKVVSGAASPRSLLGLFFLCVWVVVWVVSALVFGPEASMALFRSLAWHARALTLTQVGGFFHRRPSKGFLARGVFSLPPLKGFPSSRCFFCAAPWPSKSGGGRGLFAWLTFALTSVVTRLD